MTLIEIEIAAEVIRDDWRKNDRSAAVAREHLVMSDFVRALSRGEVKQTVIAMGAKALIAAIETGDRATEARVMPRHAANTWPEREPAAPPAPNTCHGCSSPGAHRHTCSAKAFLEDK